VRALLEHITNVFWHVNEETPNRGRFEKGRTPFNKGKPHPYGKETEFKKGEFVGDSHPSWKGGVQKNKNDCNYLWDGANKRLRRPAKVWADHNGPIPQGMCIIHKDGDRYNDDIDNLELISRADLMRRNSRTRRQQ